MHQHEPWDLLSDQRIWDNLSDVDYPVNEDFIRYMFIELFSRLKNLEVENHALKVLLFEKELIDQDTYYKVLPLVKEFLANYDEEKTKEADFYRQSGISFADWVNLFTKGSFKKHG